MTIATGRDFLAIPGPTVIPDEVLGAMHRPAVDIYSGGLPEITDRCLAGVKWLMQTNGRSYLYIANGHGAWEAAVSNLLVPGDKVLILATGRFAPGWGEMAESLGVEIETLDFGWRQAVDVAQVEARLKQDSEGRIKAVMVVQIDTASGVINDIPGVRKAIDNAGHSALFLVDVVASLGSVAFNMDAWGVDVTVGAMQKGLMSPPGMSFNGVSEKALARHRQIGKPSSYWDWTAREGEIHYQKYCGTPPEHLLFAFNQSLTMLETEGLPAIFNRHHLLAKAVRAAVGVWAEAGLIEFNILKPEERADSLTVVKFNAPEKLDMLMGFCQEKCNVTLGVGLGDNEGKTFRIAHMGYVNAPSVMGVLGVLDLAFKHLGLPHGEGALEAATSSLSQELTDFE